LFPIIFFIIVRPHPKSRALKEKADDYAPISQYSREKYLFQRRRNIVTPAEIPAENVPPKLFRYITAVIKIFISRAFQRAIAIAASVGMKVESAMP
jgi:hypothetical protein